MSADGHTRSRAGVALSALRALGMPYNLLYNMSRSKAPDRG